MKILLTGVSGFIGQYIYRALCQIYDPQNIVALTSNTDGLPSAVAHNQYQFAHDIFIKHHHEDIEIIIHAGAFIPKSSQNVNDILLCNSNIQSTEQLISCELPHLKKIIYLSTVDVYGAEKILTEEHIPAPASLYGASKHYCEQLLRAFCKQRCVYFHCLRIGHVYGPGEEKFQKVIPIAINNILKQGLVKLYGDGSDLRSFIYIDDVVRAIINAVPINDNIGIINVVGERAYSIKFIIDQLIAIHDQPITQEIIETQHKARHLVFDHSKLKRLLLPKQLPIRDGLYKEYQYMKEKLNEY